MKNKIMTFIPAPGFLTYTLLILQLCYYIIFMLKNVQGFSTSTPDSAAMLFSFFSLYIIGVILESLINFRTLARVLSPVIIFTACLLYSYRLSTGSSLDFALVKDNIGISFSMEALQMISAPFDISDFLIMSALLSAVILLEIKFSLFSKKRVSDWRGLTAATIMAGVIIFIPVQRGDEFTLFIKSALAGTGNQAMASVSDTTGFPYERGNINLTNFRSTVPSSKSSQPNIILILIESFNANFVQAKAPDGIDYTPNFNSLINRGIYQQEVN